MAVNADLHLWRAVLVHGLHDVARGKDDGWIGSTDFRTVCTLADVEAEAVLRAYVPERFERIGKVA